MSAILIQLRAMTTSGKFLPYLHQTANETTRFTFHREKTTLHYTLDRSPPQLSILKLKKIEIENKEN